MAKKMSSLKKTCHPEWNTAASALVVLQLKLESLPDDPETEDALEKVGEAQDALLRMF